MIQVPEIVGLSARVSRTAAIAPMQAPVTAIAMVRAVPEPVTRVPTVKVTATRLPTAQATVPGQVPRPDGLDVADVGGR